MANETIIFLHEKGHCTRCKTKDSRTRDGRYLCSACAIINRTYNINYYAEHRAEILRKKKDRRNERISRGECVRCGKPADKGLTLCAYHLELNRAECRSRGRRKAARIEEKT